MSMIQIAFLRKADLPLKRQIQDSIQKLGYDFKILDALEKEIDQDGLECSINGHQIYFETYVDFTDDAISDNEADWIRTDLKDQDTAISFVWGSDLAAGACIGLISIALIDLSNASVYYLDEQMKYTREMLLADTSQFLVELSVQSSKNKNSNHQECVKPNLKNTTWWGRFKNKFK